MLEPSTARDAEQVGRTLDIQVVLPRDVDDVVADVGLHRRDLAVGALEVQGDTVRARSEGGGVGSAARRSAMRQLEKGGRTPRQALAGPCRRAETL